MLLQLSDVFYLTCTVNTCQTPEAVSSSKPLDLHNWCWNAQYEYQLCVSVCFRIGLSSVFVGKCSCPCAVWSGVHWAKKELHIRSGLTFTALCACRCLECFLYEHIKRLKINIKHLKTLLCTYLFLNAPLELWGKKGTCTGSSGCPISAEQVFWVTWWWIPLFHWTTPLWLQSGVNFCSPSTFGSVFRQHTKWRLGIQAGYLLPQISQQNLGAERCNMCIKAW